MQTDTSQADAGGEGSDDDYEKVRLGGGAHISAAEGAVEGGGRLSESWGPWGWRVEPGTEAWLPAQAGSQWGGGTPPRSRAMTLTLTLDPDHSGATAQLSLHQHHRVLRGGKVGAPSAFLHGLVWADLRFSAPCPTSGVPAFLAAPRPGSVHLPLWPPVLSEWGRWVGSEGPRKLPAAGSPPHSCVVVGSSRPRAPGGRPRMVSTASGTPPPSRER